MTSENIATLIIGASILSSIFVSYLLGLAVGGERQKHNP